MPNGDHRRPFPLPRPPSRLEIVESNLHQTINLLLALHATLMAKGLSTHEEIDKMARIVEDARPKLGKEFTIEEGIKAIITAWRIETGGISEQ